MRTLRRYLVREIAGATALVFMALLMLFAFFDLIKEIGSLGQGNYRLPHMLIFVLLSAPHRVYEIFPIAVLIGTLFSLAQLVSSSEYTVMRTSGVSLIRMSVMLGSLGLVFAVMAFVFGEFVAPPAEQLAQRLRSLATTGVVAKEFRSGLWVKDGKSFINVLEVLPDTSLKGVRVYDFDDATQLRSISFAKRGEYQGGRQWLLKDVVRTTFEDRKTNVSTIAEVRWRSVLDPELLNTLLVKPEQMSAWALYSYAQHLRDNHQKALRYEIALWTKIMYPLAVLVMMVLALPFAVYQKRQGGVGAKIFSGIMLGLAFYFLNRLFAYLGLLNDWLPVLSAVLPTLIFFAMAVGMMWWQERR